jgi:bacteriorhodopsin
MNPSEPNPTQKVFRAIPASEDDAFDETLMSAKPRKSTWLWVYAALAMVAAACMVFIQIYRQMPKKAHP